MEMESEKYLDDLIVWLQALDLETPVTKDSLYIGRCIAEGLHKIDSVFFHEGWLEKVQRYEESANWRVKANNLRKIFRRISEFYRDRMSRELGPEWMLDPSRIADDDGEEVLSCLMQLVLGAALLSKSNEIFVPALLNLPESVQVTAMYVVQKIEAIPVISDDTSTTEHSTRETSTVSEKSNEQVAALSADVEHLHSERDRLNRELKETREEMDRVLLENETLKQRVDELHGNAVELEALKKQLRLVQISRESAQESLFKVEAERDHLKESLERLTEENLAFKTTVDGIIPFEEEFRKMKDELEEYRLRAHEFDKMSAQIETLKQKIREHKSQEIEMKVLNEKIATYMQSVIALEDEQRKNAALKTQLEALRLGNNDINNKLRAEIKRGDKAEFECKRAKERADEATQELERLRNEYKQLKESFVSKNEKIPVTRSASSLHDETMEIAGAPATVQERLLKLEAENEHLKSASAESEKIQMMKDEIDNLKAQIAETETEARLANLQNVELEAKLKDAEEQLMSGKTDDGQRLVDQQEKNEKLRVALAQMEARLDEAKSECALLRSENVKLTEEKQTKDTELAEEKQKLVKYLEKARRVINDLEEQNQAVEGGALSRHEFDSIRKERDNYKQYIEAMKESMERSRSLQEQEQQLVTTHVYHMMMQLHQQSTLAGSGLGGGMSGSGDSGISSRTMVGQAPTSPEKSFLTRQRQCGTFNISS